MRQNEEKRSLTEDYLEKVGANIRWKKARKPLLDELRAHIDDCREENLRQGMNGEEAERAAVGEMGSAEETGTALDRIHRPQPNWLLFGCAAVLLILGNALLAAFGVPAPELTRTLVYSLLGVIFMFIGYFCDYTQLGRAPFAVCFGLGAVCFVLSLTRRSLLSTAASQLCYILPLTFAAAVWKTHDKGRNGLLTLYAAEAACLAAALASMNPAAMAIYMLTACTAVFAYAAVKDRLGMPKRRAVIFSLLPAAAAIPAFVLFFLNGSRNTRLLAAFRPEAYPDSLGFLALGVKEMLRNSVFVGEGAPSEIFADYYEYAAENILFTTNYFLAATSNRFGWIVFAVVAAMIAFMTAAVIKAAKRQNCVLGTMVVIAVGVSFAVRALFYIAGNLGFMLFELDGLPLFSGCGKLVVIDMFMLGVLLSVFRNGSISRDSRIYAHYGR